MSNLIKALIVHNSDKVKTCFIGTEEQIFEKLKASPYWEDVVNRLVDEDLEDEELEESYQTNHESKITIWMIDSDLHHDGDSEDGYTLIQPV